MVLKVVPLAKLLPHAHFPVNEDPSRIPSPGEGTYYRPKVLKIR